MRSVFKMVARCALLAAMILGAPWPAGLQSTVWAVLQQPPPDPNTLIGIGAQLGVDGGYPMIRDLVKGGPAEMDGRLKPNDRIAGVAQANGAFVDCTNLPLDQVVDMIRGRKGSTVRLQIIPAGAADPSKREVISLVRAAIKITPQGPLGVLLQAVPGLQLQQFMLNPGNGAALAPNPAPEPSPAQAGGGKTGLSDHKERIVVLDFWPTWCVIGPDGRVDWIEAGYAPNGPADVPREEHLLPESQPEAAPPGNAQ